VYHVADYSPFSLECSMWKIRRNKVLHRWYLVNYTMCVKVFHFDYIEWNILHKTECMLVRNKTHYICRVDFWWDAWCFFFLFWTVSKDVFIYSLGFTQKSHHGSASAWCTMMYSLPQCFVLYMTRAEKHEILKNVMSSSANGFKTQLERLWLWYRWRRQLADLSWMDCGFLYTASCMVFYFDLCWVKRSLQNGVYMVRPLL
jgi:hypothetical protein